MSSSGSWTVVAILFAISAVIQIFILGYNHRVSTTEDTHICETK